MDLMLYPYKLCCLYPISSYFHTCFAWLFCYKYVLFNTLYIKIAILGLSIFYVRYLISINEMQTEVLPRKPEILSENAYIAQAFHFVSLKKT